MKKGDTGSDGPWLGVQNNTVKEERMDTETAINQHQHLPLTNSINSKHDNNKNNGSIESNNERGGEICVNHNDHQKKVDDKNQLLEGENHVDQFNGGGNNNNNNSNNNNDNNNNSNKVDKNATANSKRKDTININTTPYGNNAQIPEPERRFSPRPTPTKLFLDEILRIDLDKSHPLIQLS